MISKYFALTDLTRSSTAKRLGIENKPTTEHEKSLKNLAINVLDKIYDHFKRNVNITSGYRSDALNKAVKGSTTSQHSKGEAADLTGIGGVTNAQIFNFIKDNVDFDQLIWEFGNSKEPDWVHVSYKTLNRRQILVAYKEGKRTIYKPYK